MKKDNRGVTLIELLVVMIIMGILAGGAMYGIRSLNTGSAQSTTKRIESMLDYVRMEHMSKGSNYVLILREEDKEYYLLVQSDQGAGRKTVLEEKLDLRGGEISFFYSNPGEVEETSVLLRSTDELEICYSKESGAFLKNSKDQIIKAIRVEASSRSYTIRLVQETGKHYLE